MAYADEFVYAADPKPLMDIFVAVPPDGVTLNVPLLSPVANVYVVLVLSDAGILTVLFSIPVTRPLASTVMYGTLNVAPYPGVAFADGP